MDLKALDILSADVNDKLNVRHKTLCGGEMGHCFHNAEINAESVFNDLFAVAGHRSCSDLHIGMLPVKLL